VSHYRAANTLQRKLADGLDRYRFLDGLPHSRADEDLTGLGFIAKPGRDIGHCPNRGIIEAAFKSDRAERRKAMRDADPEAKVVTKVAPFFDQSADCRAHIERHQGGLQRRILDWDRIIENDHHDVASKSLQRAAVFENDLADSLMVVAQQRHNVFWVRAFREAC